MVLLELCRGNTKHWGLGMGVTVGSFSRRVRRRQNPGITGISSGKNL